MNNFIGIGKTVDSAKFVINSIIESPTSESTMRYWASATISVQQLLGLRG